MSERPDGVEIPVYRRFVDRYAKYARGSLINHLPFSMTVVGSRHTGKTEFIEAMMAGEMAPLKFDYDRYTYYSNSRASNKNIVTTPYSNLNQPRGVPGEHSLVVFDDPPVGSRDFQRMMGNLMRNGRHGGMSVVTVLHSLSDMGLAQNRHIRANTNITVLPSRFVNQNMAAIQRHNLYPYDLTDLNREESFNYNIIDDRQHLTVIRRPRTPLLPLAKNTSQAIN